MICREDSTLITLDKSAFDVLLGDYYNFLK